jgi:hypothetical protein
LLNSTAANTTPDSNALMLAAISLKFSHMKILCSLLSFITISSIGNIIAEKIQVSANIIAEAKISSITLAIHVRNSSGKLITMNKHRIFDYKREKIGSKGNYIVEIQIQENGKYHLLEPTADINPGFNNGEMIKISSGETFHDTIEIRGSLFREGVNYGFKTGSYRLRVTFNSDFWGGGVSEITDWIEYKIESE